MPLTEDGIHAVALKLIDADGVEALTMRKLAAALNANPMSLYHHVPNKDALLRGVARRVGSQFRTPEVADLPWQDRLRRLGMDFRALTHRHPKLMAYCFGHPDFLQPEDPLWQGLTHTLADAHLPTLEIPRIAATVCAVVSGLLLSELTGALQRWATLSPAPADAEEACGTVPAPSQEVIDAMFGCVLNAAIAGVERHIADAVRKP